MVELDIIKKYIELCCSLDLRSVQNYLKISVVFIIFSCAIVLVSEKKWQLKRSLEIILLLTNCFMALNQGLGHAIFYQAICLSTKKKLGHKL
jgi:uncharacterized membrane protein